MNPRDIAGERRRRRSISGTYLSRQLCMLLHWDKICSLNLLSHADTIYWHQANQSKQWPCKCQSSGRKATRVPFSQSLVWPGLDLNIDFPALEVDMIPIAPLKQSQAVECKSNYIYIWKQEVHKSPNASPHFSLCFKHRQSVIIKATHLPWNNHNITLNKCGLYK